MRVFLEKRGRLAHGVAKMPRWRRPLCPVIQKKKKKKRTRTVNKWPRSTVFLQGTQACPSFCLLSCCSDKPQDQEKLWGVKGFSLHVIVHRWGKGKHECGGRNRQRPRRTGAGVSPPTVVWVLPHWLLTKKMLHRLAYRPIWCREFFNWCFLFSFSFSCQMTVACVMYTKNKE